MQRILAIIQKDAKPVRSQIATIFEKLHVGDLNCKRLVLVKVLVLLG